MDIFWELYQLKRTSDAIATARDAERKATDLESRVDPKVFQLEKQVERLSLGCQAMWELLTEILGVDQETILAKMEEIDLRDGKRDGKIHREQVECQSCGRLGHTGRARCLYCGSDLNRRHLFG